MDASLKPQVTTAATIEPVVRPSREAAEAAVRTLIAWAGDDPRREGMLDTPGNEVTSAYAVRRAVCRL